MTDTTGQANGGLGHASALHTTGAHATVASPDAPLLWILMPKWLTARARAMAGERGRGARFAILATVGLLFWGFIFGLLYRLLTYFKGVPEIGELLADKLLGLMLVSFFSLLLLSNVITALSSFFLAKDLDLLVSAPVDWLRVYSAKLMETTIFSSWMVVLMAIPMFAAYGIAYDGGWGFAPFIAFALVPFLVIPSVLGSATTLLLVNIFPARRTRDILSVIAVMTAGGIVLLFRLVRPEKLARPRGSVRSSTSSRCCAARRRRCSPASGSRSRQWAIWPTVRTGSRCTCSGPRRRRWWCSARCCTGRSTPRASPRRRKARNAGQRRERCNGWRCACSRRWAR
ncbi:MAG: hypothetical protein FJ363_03555 [Gemmatimonadetes bacterium]|nr:hypothetical protein [Gemmatimonadota bacterium]